MPSIYLFEIYIDGLVRMIEEQRSHTLKWGKTKAQNIFSL